MSSRRYAHIRRALAAAITGLAVFGLSTPVLAQTADSAPRWSLAIHGGAGTIERDRMTPAQDAAYRAALTRRWKPARPSSRRAVRRWMRFKRRWS